MSRIGHTFWAGLALLAAELSASVMCAEITGEEIS